MKNIKVYTDGSLIKKGNEKYCGYGIYFPDGELENISENLTIEILKKLTNNRAELYAIYRAIIYVEKNIKFDLIEIHSDSLYSIKSLTQWIKQWKINNWLTSKNKPVENKDLLLMIDEKLEKYGNKIKLIHVFAHLSKENKSLPNDIADKLAKNGAMIYMTCK